jgi:hypothetical protein
MILHKSSCTTGSSCICSNSTHLLTTMLHCPLVVLQANAWQLSGWGGQGEGQVAGLQLPDWHVPLGPEQQQRPQQQQW